MKAAFGALLLLFGLGSNEARAQDTAELTLAKGVVIPLRLLDQVSSLSAQNGDVLHLEALRDVSAQRHLLVRTGAPASGTVDFVAKSWKKVQGGQLRILLNQVLMANGQPLPLQSVFGAFGGGFDRTHTNRTVVSNAAASGIEPFGGLLGLTVGGQEIIFPKGTRMDGYVLDPLTLDPTKFAIAEVSWTDVNGDPLPPPVQPPKETLKIQTETGDGSVYVDGVFRAEAPAAVELDRGLHLVVILKDGYKVLKLRVLVDGEDLELLMPMVKK